MTSADKVIKIALEAVADVEGINVRHASSQALEMLGKIRDGLGLQLLTGVDHTNPSFEVLRHAHGVLEERVINAALDASIEPGNSLLQMKESLALIKRGISLNCPFDEEGQKRNELLMASEAGLKIGIKMQEKNELQKAWARAKFHYR